MIIAIRLYSNLLNIRIATMWSCYISEKCNTILTIAIVISSLGAPTKPVHVTQPPSGYGEGSDGVDGRSKVATSRSVVTGEAGTHTGDAGHDDFYRAITDVAELQKLVSVKVHVFDDSIVDNNIMVTSSFLFNSSNFWQDRMWSQEIDGGYNEFLF